jgi:hypothetical protein
VSTSAATGLIPLRPRPVGAVRPRRLGSVTDGRCNAWTCLRRPASPLGSTTSHGGFGPCLAAVLFGPNSRKYSNPDPLLIFYSFAPAASSHGRFFCFSDRSAQAEAAGIPLVVVLPALACPDTLLIISSKRRSSGESLMRTGTSSSRAFHHHGGRRRGGRGRRAVTVTRRSREPEPSCLERVHKRRRQGGLHGHQASCVIPTTMRLRGRRRVSARSTHPARGGDATVQRGGEHEPASGPAEP